MHTECVGLFFIQVSFRFLTCFVFNYHFSFRFRARDVAQMIESVLSEHLKDSVYDAATAGETVKGLTATLIERVKGAYI